MSPLHPDQRLELAVLGWQAECACQIGATHLATSWRFAIGNDKMPDDVIACIEIGRKALRAHLAVVRGDPDHTMITVPPAYPQAHKIDLATAFAPAAFEAVLTATTKTGTRTRTSQLLIKSDPGDTSDQFLEKLGIALVHLARE